MTLVHIRVVYYKYFFQLIVCVLFSIVLRSERRDCEGDGQREEGEEKKIKENIKKTY